MGKGEADTGEEGRVVKVQPDLRRQKESERFPALFLFRRASMFLVGELLTPMGWSKTPPHAMLMATKIVFQTQGGLRLASYWINAAMSTSAHRPSPRLLFGHIIIIDAGQG